MIDIITPLFGKSKSSAPKRFRYVLRFKGGIVSKHYTLKAVKAAQKKLRGSTFSKIGAKKVSTFKSVKKRR